MHAQNFLVNQRCNGQTIEAVCERLPYSDIQASLALIIEAINSVDLAGLVIAAEQEEVLWVLDLVGKEEADSLKRLLSTIDIVTQEQVVCIRWEPTVLEEP